MELIFNNFFLFPKKKTKTKQIIIQYSLTNLSNKFYFISFIDLIQFHH
jgi:hypothetical protein